MRLIVSLFILLFSYQTFALDVAKTFDGSIRYCKSNGDVSDRNDLLYQVRGVSREFKHDYTTLVLDISSLKCAKTLSGVKFKESVPKKVYQIKDARIERSNFKARIFTGDYELLSEVPIFKKRSSKREKIQFKLVTADILDLTTDQYFKDLYIDVVYIETTSTPNESYKELKTLGSYKLSL